MKITKHYFRACNRKKKKKKEKAIDTQFHFKRMRLEGKSGEDTGHDGTEASGVAASAVENRRRGRRGSRGGAGRNGAGGETDGGQGGARGGTDGGDTGGGDLGARGGGRSGGLRLGADGGGDLDARVDGGRGRNGSLGLGADGGGLGSLDSHGGGAGAGAGTGASSGGDTELGRVLVLAGTLNNEEQTVVGGVGLEVRARSPLELAAVGDGLGEGLQRDDVGGGTAQENQRDGTSSGGSPLDGVGLALRNDLVQARRDDGIATGVLAVIRSSVGSGHGHEGGESGCDGETHDDLSVGIDKE